MEDGYQVPRGGPIYLQDVVGQLLTKVPVFETSVVQELQSLKAELNSAASDDGDLLSVDELKVLSEEELVEKAFQDTFPLEEVDAEEKSANRDEDGDRGGASDQVQEGGDENSANSDNNNNKKQKQKRMQKQNKKQRLKRGRKFDRETRAHLLESPILIAKVEQVAQIKRKQEEDKLAARLHSFSGGSKLAVVSSSSSLTENLGKMQTLRFTSSDAKVKTQSNVHQDVPIIYPEVILCVEVYNAKKSWVKTQELLVLGSQRLSHLRDQIECLTDELMHKVGKSDPSGYFLIEDMFCNDKRDPSAIDYSEPIFEWLNNSKDEAKQKWEAIRSGELQHKQRTLFESSPTKLPHFKTREMDKIRFCDLSFKLGAAYLYCHQGDCKHNIVIRDMRLIHKEDIQNRALYPLLVYQHKNRYNKCSVCNIYLAKKVTLDDKWAQENPCYFCDNCYYLLHYKTDGTLLYSDFTVYDYYHE